MQADTKEIDLMKMLGASMPPSSQQFALYIPNKDKKGNKIRKLSKWIKEASLLLSLIGGGTTTMPPADGTWLKRDIENIEELRDEDLLREKTTIMYTYIIPDKFEKNLNSLREFLHRFGRETNQGEVVFEFGGEFFKIREYD